MEFDRGGWVNFPPGVWGTVTGAIYVDDDGVDVRFGAGICDLGS